MGLQGAVLSSQSHCQTATSYPSDAQTHVPH